MSRRIIMLLIFIVSLFMFSLWLFGKPVVVIGVAVNGEASSLALEGRMLSVVQSYVMWHNNKTESSFKYQLKSFVYKDPSDAVSALKDEKAVVIIGYPLSSEAMKVVDLAGELKIPVISPICSSPYLSKKKDWFFSMVKNSFQEGHLQSKMLRHLGARDLIVFKSSNNRAYVDSLFHDLALSEDRKISVTEELSYPDSLNHQYKSADAAFIILDPSRAFWTLQEVHLRYPDMPVLLSRWSWISDLDKYRDIPGSDFYINSPFDHVSDVKDPFVSFMDSYLSIELSDLVLHTVVAMKLLDDVFENEPGSHGENLRSLLSLPRSIDFSGKTIRFDSYGDAYSESSFYHYNEGLIQEISVR